MGNEYYLNSISHHGILGQKWGKLNGPPYPLSKSDLSAAEKKADNKNRSIKETNKPKQKSGLSQTQKENIEATLIVGGTIVSALLFTYSNYNLSQTGSRGIATANLIAELGGAYIGTKLGQHILDSKEGKSKKSESKKGKSKRSETDNA